MVIHDTVAPTRGAWIETCKHIKEKMPEIHLKQKEKKFILIVEEQGGVEN